LVAGNDPLQIHPIAVQLLDLHILGGDERTRAIGGRAEVLDLAGDERVCDYPRGGRRAGRGNGLRELALFELVALPLI